MINFIKKNPVFSKLASINLLSKVGDRLFYTAMISTAATLPQANIAVMIVSISETLPILFGFFLGNVADKKPNKIFSMIKNSILRFVLYLIISIIFSYNSTISLLISAACLNFLSDILGNYSSALTAPFTKILVNNTDMERAQGFLSTTTQLVNVLATFLGAFLLSIFFTKDIALINALIFASTAIGFLILSNSLKKFENKIPVQNYKSSNIEVIKNNFKDLASKKKIIDDLLQLSLLNGFFGGLTPIFVLFLQSLNQNIVSQSFLISSLSGIITFGMILGNSVTSKIFTSISNKKLNMLANIFVVGVGVSLFLNNIFLVFIASFIVSLIIGIVSPRFTATVIKDYPVERLGGIITTVNSFLVLLPPLASLLFPLIASYGIYVSFLVFIVYAISSILLSIILVKNN